MKLTFGEKREILSALNVRRLVHERLSRTTVGENRKTISCRKRRIHIKSNSKNRHRQLAE